MRRYARKDSSRPHHNSTGGALPSLRLMLENGRANGCRWRVSAGFLLQAALLALVLLLPLFHTEPLDAQGRGVDTPVYVVVAPRGEPGGTGHGPGSGPPSHPRPPLPDLSGSPILPTPIQAGIPELGPEVSPGNGLGPAGAGIPDGSSIGISGGTGPGVTLPPPAGPIRLGGRLRAPRLIQRVEPDYPLLALRAGIEGDVVLEAVLGADGRVQEVAVVRGHALLAKAAQAAVQQWVYEPTYLNDQPVPVILEVVVRFRLHR